MKPFFLFLLLLLVPTTLAYDCSQLEGIQYEDCLVLKDLDENVIANVMYSNYSYPDHTFISSYNDPITVLHAPERVDKRSSGIIKNAWVVLLSLSPSVLSENSLYVPSDFSARSEYDYTIEVPPDYHSNRKRDGRTCKILYSLDSTSESFKVTADGSTQGTSKLTSCSITQDTTVTSQLEVTAKLKEREYEWDKYCCSRGKRGCKRWCYKCKYDRTKYSTSKLTVTDSQEVSLYKHIPNATYEYYEDYYGSTKGQFQKDENTSITLEFNNSLLQITEYDYGAVFTNQPFYFLQLTAFKETSTSTKNLIKNKNTLYVKDKEGCTLKKYDFFTSIKEDCIEVENNEEIEEIEITGFTNAWSLLLKIVVFIFVNFLIYSGIKKYWGEYLS